MKSYLDLVPISSRLHRKQNRMSIFCIVLAVFLVTVIFGMADMFIRSQIMQARMEDGNWHVSFRNISEEQARLISARPEVEASSWYGVLNYSGEQGYSLQGKNLILCGSEESWITKMQTDMITEGAFPKKDNEALMSENAKTAMDLKIGDLVFVETPVGKFQITISGFLKNVSKTMEEDSYGVFLTTDGFRSIYQQTEKDDSTYFNSIYFVQFSNRCNINNTISDIKAQLGLSGNQVSENTKLLGLLGQSGNSFMLQIYGSAFILFLLVLMAGVMMIASSLNSNVAQRTEFFGMMRCIGATPKQVMRLVVKEAFGWCKFAIPAGVGAGVIVIWILCAMLRYLSPEYFIGMPAFAISFPSVISGICIGALTVFFAARSPAKKASRVSPLAAISGINNKLFHGKKAASTAFFKIDTALGIHHAKSSKGNFVLMVGSFSLSIILFLSFSVTIDFMNHALKPLKPWTPDISIVSPNNSCSISNNLLKDLEENPAVKKAYGRMFAYNVPIQLNGVDKTVDLISYEEHQFDWAKDYLLEGSLQRVQNEVNTGLSVFKQQGTPKVGDTVTFVENRSVDIEIVGTLSSSPFQNVLDVGTIICSENTFRQLTGNTDYTIIDLQLLKSATQKDVDLIHAAVGSEYIFSDERLGNRSVLGSYYSFGLFIYGFMTLIALITIFNIVNSIAMSVSARMKEYVAFRAIGLSNQQMKKMIVAEASTYAVVGGFWGSVLGLLFNKLLYEKMITFYWGEQWKIPFVDLGIILGIVIIAVMIAVNGPLKRIRKISIVDTMSAQ
ncbi:ABC transporter permease [Anaerotignum propionicum]|uniref:ABC transporter permease n=1 Tax=Anaerotignum propionicum TaxID=28446 RepID=UPI00210BB379|nr:ABC transporter permease [Anaerotignum propionicum]MCQ4937313.1 ABC transporter permease [Anaerotignum propionicum]